MPLPPVGTPRPGEMPRPGGPGVPDRLAWLADPDYLASLDQLTETDLAGSAPDPLAGPPDGEDAWLGGLSLAELDAVAAAYAAGDGRLPAQDAVGAGFGRDLPADPALGFAAGGPLDCLAPGPVLAGFAGRAFDQGLGGLSDDELVGVLGAARRLQAWQVAVEFTAIAELDARRRARADRPESSRVHDQVNAELAAALIMTGRSADALLDLARGLARLPAVVAALAQGRIDRDRAAVFAAELAVLDARAAAGVAIGFTGVAGSMTTGQLRAALRATVLALYPETARERAERGRAHARVEIWPESSGNAGLAVRELPPAEVIEADARITAIAHALKDAGAPGHLDQLRVAVFTALLTGRDPATIHPGPATSANPATSTDTGNSCNPGTSPGSGPSNSAGPGTSPSAGIAGTVHLTMPASAWLGHTDAPGEVAGAGPADVGTCRDLAGRLAASPGTRWCLTLTGPDGRAIAHGCARAGPVITGPPGTGPPARTAAWQAWLASLQLEWLERDRCGHPRRIKSYRPGRTLRHLLATRHRTCGFPSCSRPAARCDLDHTIPYDQGGITCDCNLAALCRQHHKTKQAQGWQLSQPEPGVLTWSAPHGRSYTVHPGKYPI